MTEDVDIMSRKLADWRHHSTETPY